MDMLDVKKLINKNILDFSELVLNNYHKIGLDETDAIMVIKLNYLLNRNITFIHPKKLSNMLSISSTTTSKRLNSLIEKGFVKIELVKNGNGKETESFNLDYVIEKIMKADFEEKMALDTDPNANIESKLVLLFETEFRKQLSVLDIQTITKWLNEDGYQYEDIKNALFEASKARKLSVRYIDGILLNKGNQKQESRIMETTLIKDLKKIWTE